MSAKKQRKLKVVDPPAPDIKKSPVRFELHFEVDETGLRMKQLVGVFIYCYPDDPFGGGAEKSPLILEAKDRAFLEELYDGGLSSFIAKHKTLSRAHGIAHNAKMKQMNPAAPR